MHEMIVMLGLAWLAVLVSGKLDWAILERVRDFGKPFNCAMCLGLHFGWITGLILGLGWLTIPFALTVSAVAVILERNTRDII